MRVVFLSQIIPYPPHGGVLQRGFNIVRELGSRVELHLAAFNHPDILPTDELVEESREVLSEFCESVTYFELLPKRSPLYKWLSIGAGVLDPRPFSVIAHRSAALKRWLVDFASNNSVDLVHYDTIGLAHYRMIMGNVPSVLTHHNIESQLMARRAENDRWPAGAYAAMQSRKLRRYEAEQSPLFDINVVVSSVDEIELHHLAPGISTVVVPNGVDTDYFSPEQESGTASLVWAGGMNMFANRDAVVYFVEQIWPRVCREQPDVIFHIVGQDAPAQLMDLAERDSRLRIHGFVDDVRGYIQQASVYVVPIRVGGGTRLKVLDALALGKPIVSTSIGCEGIDVTDRVNIRVADDPNVFADTIVELLRDTDQRKALGTAARSLAESSYSWGPITDTLLGAYRSAIGSHCGQ